MSRAVLLALNFATHLAMAVAGIMQIETAFSMWVGGGLALFQHWLLTHPRDQKERI
ncbi:hypothetical protein JWJ88_17425 [Paracoccus methylovorus]|uniref:Uncharacterized protein n=1 Tax=Paracoccus methylovorus TaxID=2812658 RepID=A0ABX7JMM7_9RHOB|nr:hypothetical protein [Paracoccus methylovorus]QRZ14746.1 hypothetical protein JWJ88_17425 [Paracoccus methylovorus]